MGGYGERLDVNDGTSETYSYCKDTVSAIYIHYGGFYRTN